MVSYEGFLTWLKNHSPWLVHSKVILDGHAFLLSYGVPCLLHQFSSQNETCHHIFVLCSNYTVHFKVSIYIVPHSLVGQFHPTKDEAVSSFNNKHYDEESHVIQKPNRSQFMILLWTKYYRVRWFKKDRWVHCGKLKCMLCCIW